jgi:hypothetical protein
MFRLILMILKGGGIMVDMYIALILAGRRTFLQVPTKYQEAVHLDLLALGLDDNGNPIVTA